MLKTPVGNLLVCNAFWPSGLFISASVTLTLSRSRASCLPSGAILTGTKTALSLPIAHLSRLPWSEDALLGYLLWEAEEESLLQRLSCYFLQPDPHRLEEHTEAWESEIPLGATLNSDRHGVVQKVHKPVYFIAVSIHYSSWKWI